MEWKTVTRQAHNYRIFDCQRACKKTWNYKREISTYGHSLIVDPWGEILAEADDSEMIITSELYLNKVQECQNAIPVLNHDRNFD